MGGAQQGNYRGGGKSWQEGMVGVACNEACCCLDCAAALFRANAVQPCMDDDSMSACRAEGGISAQLPQVILLFPLFFDLILMSPTTLID